jgi:1,4-alpha-glucan branching enzyme
MWAHPGKQLLFMGSEFGQESEWSEGRSLDWWLLDQPDHEALSRLVTDLNAVYRSSPALWSLDIEPAGFEWIDANDAGGNTLSWIRRGADGELMACVVNFSAIPHHDYRVGLPVGGTWSEVINTDASEYGGSGVGNFGAVHAEQVEWHGRPFSASVSVPPLGAVWFRPQ